MGRSKAWIWAWVVAEMVSSPANPLLYHQGEPSSPALGSSPSAMTSRKQGELSLSLLPCSPGGSPALTSPVPAPLLCPGVCRACSPKWCCLPLHRQGQLSKLPLVGMGETHHLHLPATSQQMSGWQSVFPCSQLTQGPVTRASSTVLPVWLPDQ